MMGDVVKVAEGLTAAQRRDLERVCRTNGGGVHVTCRVREDGYGEPVSGPMRKLYEKDLIQGKSGAYSTVVHTCDGLAVWKYLLKKSQQPPSPKEQSRG